MDYLAAKALFADVDPIASWFISDFTTCKRTADELLGFHKALDLRAGGSLACKPL